MIALSTFSLRPAVLAAGLLFAATSAMPAFGQDGGPGRGPGGRNGGAGIVSQLEGLGLDPATVKTDLEGLSRDERIAYLEGLGISLPEPALHANGIGAQLTALGLDPATVLAGLEGLSKEERRAELEALGVVFPEPPVGRVGIVDQLEALGLDPDTVKAELEGMDRDARRAYLESLGVTVTARR